MAAGGSVLGRLWRGELPLAELFWLYVVLGGILVNLVTSGVFLALVTAERLPLAFLVGYGLSLPYNMLVLVGLWRASRQGSPRPSEGPVFLAIAIVLMAILSLT